MKVSAVLIKYKRLDELKKICDHLETFDFIDEILIHDNTENNLKLYGRYLTALKARNDTIYVQDDDCIVDVEKLFRNYDGTRLVNGMKAESIKYYSGIHSLVGWGAFFDKAWIKVLDKYTDEYGKDDIFLRECDRIFTSLLTKKTVIIDIKDFPSANSDDALYKQANHKAYFKEALKRLRGLI